MIILKNLRLALSIVQSRSSMFSLFSMAFIYPRWSVGSRRFCVIAAATCEIIWDPCDIAAPLLTVVHSGLSNNRSPCWALYHHTRGIEMPPGASKNDRIHTFLPSYNNLWNTILKITITMLKHFNLIRHLTWDNLAVFKSRFWEEMLKQK